MRKILIILLLLTSSSTLWAQRPQREYDKDKLEAARVAFVTNRINLTPTQAEKFWPLYNQHLEERSGYMREMMSINRQAGESISDSQAEKLIEQRFQIQEKMMQSEKAFTKKITEVISPVQALQLSNVNRDFTRQLYRMQRDDRRSRHSN
ncbi:Spy/CpxP family protein refolding chaperone [Litoribacter alkaliphilus]|uniref:Spy/CpxP family protein refolding chaperone n=1 Tax=Litoribacter ruber TaxID=702568 RepID=A0AAP2CMU1_9BACT|nr:Spy/CpxP family protein refolding chaperone [Litoribacter alkaliphilus]MBS9524667.1 Spy/CpxP family protein refolding chaperone [Litoribacter alkaliphilus]